MRLRLAFGVSVLCLALCGPARGATPGANYFALDGGFFANNVVGRATAVEADQSAVSHFALYARLRRGFRLGRGFFWEPAVGTLIPWFSGVDGNSKLFTFHTDFPFLVPVFSFLKLRLGPGIEWQWIVTQTETVKLDNGTDTSDFYIPGGNRLITLFTVEAGLEIHLSQRLTLNSDVTVLSIASPTRRSYQISLGLGVYL